MIKAIKKFIKRNRIISFFGLISVVISASYAITYNMPDYFGIESWYSLFNNISISYIAALIFYILQVYKPECDNSKKAHVILNPLFLDLIKFMEVTIACCRKYVSVSDTGHIVINWWDKEQKVLYIAPTVEDSNGESHETAVRKSELELRKIDDIYKSKIREIKDRIVFRDCDTDILYALSKLEASDFFKFTIVSALKLDRGFVTYSGFPSSVDKFEVLKDEFKRCCGITHKYGVRDAEDMEMALNETIFYKDALKKGSIEEFNEVLYREYLKKQFKSMNISEEQRDQLIDSIMQDVMKVIKEKVKQSTPAK